MLHSDLTMFTSKDLGRSWSHHRVEFPSSMIIYTGMGYCSGKNTLYLVGGCVDGVRSTAVFESAGDAMGTVFRPFAAQLPVPLLRPHCVSSESHPLYVAEDGIGAWNADEDARAFIPTTRVPPGTKHIARIHSIMIACDGASLFASIRSKWYSFCSWKYSLDDVFITTTGRLISSSHAQKVLRVSLILEDAREVVDDVSMDDVSIALAESLNDMYITSYGISLSHEVKEEVFARVLRKREKDIVEGLSIICSPLAETRVSWQHVVENHLFVGMSHSSFFFRVGTNWTALVHTTDTAIRGSDREEGVCKLMKNHPHIQKPFAVFDSGLDHLRFPYQSLLGSGAKAVLYPACLDKTLAAIVTHEYCLPAYRISLWIQILIAMAYIDSCNIVHMNLSDASIAFRPDGVLVVRDFSCAQDARVVPRRDAVRCDRPDMLCPSLVAYLRETNPLLPDMRLQTSYETGRLLHFVATGRWPTSSCVQDVRSVMGDFGAATVAALIDDGVPVQQVLCNVVDALGGICIIAERIRKSQQMMTQLMV